MGKVHDNASITTFCTACNVAYGTRLNILDRGTNSKTSKQARSTLVAKDLKENWFVLRKKTVQIRSQLILDEINQFCNNHLS